MESWSEGFWFISTQFLTLLFISNRKDMGSNPVYSKSVNSVCTNKKLSYLSSLLQYNYLKKSIIYFSLQKFSSTEIIPPHPLPFICARSMPQHRKKYSTSKDYLSLLVYLYLLVYGIQIETGWQAMRSPQLLRHRNNVARNKSCPSLLCRLVTNSTA